VKRRVLAAAAALLLAVCTYAVLNAARAAATPPAVSCTNLPADVAHRGGNEMYTENTLLAFDSAYQLAGATIWETDLQFDSKNVGVILHDPTVDRTTPLTGAIKDLQASGTVRIPTDDGQQIPTEWEVLNLAQQRGARVLLELKVMPANATQWSNFWNRIDITVTRAAITIASFDTATLAAVHSRDPSVRTALVQQSGYISAADVLAQGQSFEKYGPSYTIDRFTEWHAAGIELFAWTLDDPLDWPRLVNYPVDGIITDKPLAYAGWLRMVCPPPPPPATTPPTTVPTTAVPTTDPGPDVGDPLALNHDRRCRRMTAAKLNHRAARALMLQHLDMHPGRTVHADLDPLEAGIVGDTDHADGGDSYHLGKDQIRPTGHRYSVDESARDRRGLDDYASAMDFGYFKVATGRGTFDLYDYNAWLVGLCRAGDPDTVDLREVIYSPDGQRVLRFDREGVRSTGDDSHLEHTHHSEYRDADGHRMLRLVTRWLQHIGLIPEEDDVSAQDVIDALKSSSRAAPRTARTAVRSRAGWAVTSSTRASPTASPARRPTRGRCWATSARPSAGCPPSSRQWRPVRSRRLTSTRSRLPWNRSTRTSRPGWSVRRRPRPQPRCGQFSGTRRLRSAASSPARDVDLAAERRIMSEHGQAIHRSGVARGGPGPDFVRGRVGDHLQGGGHPVPGASGGERAVAHPRRVSRGRASGGVAAVRLAAGRHYGRTIRWLTAVSYAAITALFTYLVVRGR
jgi:glycerophosphoryl diester phosphodiesterase